VGPDRALKIHDVHFDLGAFVEYND
jgi:hypothetical protein